MTTLKLLNNYLKNFIFWRFCSMTSDLSKVTMTPLMTMTPRTAAVLLLQAVPK